jgi:hypothetical protein
MMIAFLALTAASTTASLQPPLQPWAALVGHCFVGEAPGNSGTDRHCFESVYGGQHVRDHHVVTAGGREVYAGETLYSAKGPQVIFTYWNSLGGLGTGTAALGADEWRFTGTIHATATSAEQPMTATWKARPDGYEVNAEGGAPRLFKRAD